MTDSSRLRMESVPRSIAFLAVAVLLLALVPLARPANAEPGTIVEIAGDGLVPAYRYAGFNRYDTSELIATDTTDNGAEYSGDALILATGERFPDALAGSTLGGLEDAPIVLTPSQLEPGGELNEDVVEALDAYDTVETVYILGGVEAISQDIEDAILDQYDVDVVRLGGADRYATAALIADQTESVTTPAESTTAIVARGGDFPDALVAGAIAAAAELPLLLTPEDLPLDEDMVESLETLDIDRVILAGGVVALSQGVEDEIAAMGIDVERVFGENRFGTAVAFAEQAVEFAELGADRFGFGQTHVNLARGDDFPDALAFGPHAGLDSTGPAPIVLTETNELSEPTADYFVSVASPDFESLHVAGGNLAISDEVVDEARRLLTVEGVPATLTLDAESATNFVYETHTVTATVLDNGLAGVADETVTVQVDETGTTTGLDETFTVVTDESGTATVTFRSTTPGTVTLTFTVDSDTDLTATLTKTYVVPSATAYAAGAAGTTLVSFDSDDGVVDSTVALTGFTGGETSIVGLDVRPQTGRLYGIGNAGQVYLVSETSGALTAVGSPLPSFNPSGGGVGFDFNPAVDLIRIVNTADQNYRFNPRTETVTVDTTLAYETGTTNPAVSAVGYTNSALAETATSTALFGVDSDEDTLVRVTNPNGGTLSPVGELFAPSQDVTAINGLDVLLADDDANVAFALLTIGGSQSVYTVDLNTGLAEELYGVAGGYTALALVPPGA